VAVEANLAQDHLLGIVYEENDPLMFQEAMGRSDVEDWKHGIEAELKSINEHRVWTESRGMKFQWERKRSKANLSST